MTNVDRLLIGGALAGILVAGAASWSLVAALGPPPDPPAAVDPSSAAFSAAPEDPTAEMLVDVEGAVQRPGLHRVPAGSRVADALAAAGGYSDDADLVAAAARINLAAPLSDGQQIHVPRIGQAAGPEAPADTAGGLVNLNTASPEALEALPGIGPVTVQKIVAARTERPFTSLDELVERGVINRGQLEQIRDLATVQ